MFKRALAVSERVGSKADARKALWGLWAYTGSHGEYSDGLRLAQHFGELVSVNDTVETTILHHRMMALSLHLVGRHAEASSHSQIVIDQPVVDEMAARDRGYRIDQRVAGLMSMTRILWMLGQFDRALATSRQVIDRAMEIDHSLSLCFCLALACEPVAFWAGDWDSACRLNGLLLERAKRYSLDFWHAYGMGYDLLLRRRQGSADRLDSLTYPKSWKHVTEMMCTVDASLADDATLARGSSDGWRWCAPELLRIRGERARAAGDIDTAHERLQSAIELAKQHQALAWELRCATSLAELLHASGAKRDAYDGLAPVVRRLAGEFESTDLRRARALLEQLA
jgi:hypothetical protein